MLLLVGKHFLLVLLQLDILHLLLLLLMPGFVRLQTLQRLLVVWRQLGL